MRFLRFVRFWNPSKKPRCTPVPSTVSTVASTVPSPLPSAEQGSSRQSELLPAFARSSHVLAAARPSVIYIDECTEDPSLQWRMTNNTCKDAEGDRQFLEEYHRVHGLPDASTSCHRVVAGLGSMVQPRRTTTLKRGKESAHMPHELATLEQCALDHPQRSTLSKRTRRDARASHGGRQKIVLDRDEHHFRQSATQPIPARGNSRQSRTLKKKSSQRKVRGVRQDRFSFTSDKVASYTLESDQDDGSTGSYRNRPRTSTASSTTKGSRFEGRGSLYDCSSSNRSARCAAAFVLYGGSSDEPLVMKMEKNLSWHRMDVLARLPPPPGASSIPIRPTLVRDLPPLFEPWFESCFSMGLVQ